MARYSYETLKVGELALNQLNLHKNASKENFEVYTYQHILQLLLDEIWELEDELDKRRPDFNRCLEELGDVVACCVGLYAWIKKKNRGKNGI